MEAKNAVEEKILAYFEANASDDLKARVEKEKKTPAGALHYCMTQAQKQAVGNCACIDDETVFGWVMHYFEDEKASNHEGMSSVASVSTAKVKKPVRTAGHQKKTAPAPAKEQKPSKRETHERESGQLFLFDAIAEAAK